MNHLTDDQLLTALHEPVQLSSASVSHLAECDSCRARQAALRADDLMVAELLGSLDHPMPAVTAEELSVAPARPVRRRALLVAQITLAFAAAAAAMTIPASPLHKLLFPAPVLVPAPGPVPAPEVSQAPPAPPVGIALAAPASLVVEFRRPQSSGVIEVALTSGSQVTVRSRGGSVGYTVNEGRVLVDNREPADEYLIELPSALRKARIILGSKVLFFRDGERSGPAPLGDGSHYRIVLSDTLRSLP